jgi:hypothetical protein
VICYLCSFPRSGNSLVQTILVENFKRLVSRIQGHVDGPPGARDPEWEAHDAPEPVPGWPEDVLWNERTAVYRKREGAVWRRILKPGPEDTLTPELRQALAAEREIFFLKTHGDPFESYFEGERVVQIARHPGPTLWSLFRYMSDLAEKAHDTELFIRPPLTLETIIEGHPDTGAWSAYMERWMAAAETLGPRYLRLKYGEVSADPGSGVDALSNFLSLEPEVSAEVSFERYRLRWPNLDLRGSNDGYERYFSRRQLELLWERHGAVAERLGCAPPDYSVHIPDEQVRRLNSLIEAAWRRGQEVELERWRATKRLRNALDEQAQRDDA